MLTLLLLVLAVLAAYYVLGNPLLDYIHRFVQEFTHSFPLWVVFRLGTIGRAGAGNPDEAAPKPSRPPSRHR